MRWFQRSQAQSRHRTLPAHLPPPPPPPAGDMSLSLRVSRQGHLPPWEVVALRGVRWGSVHKNHHALLGSVPWFSGHLAQLCHLLTALHVQILLLPWFYHPKNSTTGSKPLREHFYQWTGRIVQQNPMDGAGVWILYSIKVHSVLEAETKQWEIQLLSPGNCSADSRGGSNPHYAINQRMQGDSVIEVKSKIPSCHWEKALASGQKYVLCRPASDAQDQEPSSLGKIVQWQNKGLN